MNVRAASWDDDAERISRIDATYSSDRVLRIDAQDLAFSLHEEAADPPVARSHVLDEFGESDALFVAEVEGDVVGVGGVRLSSWNRRATVTGLYVSGAFRGRGVGTALVEALADWARAIDAHCLWLETQNVNYPAVEFYRRAGFRLCGLDDRFYDPRVNSGDVALFFARDL